MISRSKNGGKYWNSEDKVPTDNKRQGSHRGIGRKLQDVCRDLSPLKEQGKVEGFFNNTENAGKLGRLVEDIRDAMMEYQVCASNYSFAPYLTFVPDFIAARHL